MGKFFKYAENQIVYDDPNIVERGLSAPQRYMMKLLLYDKNVGMGKSDQITKTTRKTIKDLAKENKDVQVYVGHSPFFDQLKRGLDKKGVIYNHSVSKWLGLPQHAFELLSAKMSGGDYYNPMSNSVIVRSNVPAVAAHEFGHAKDFSKRHHPFLYAYLMGMPPLNVVREYRASRNAGKYLKKHDLDSTILTPAIGTYVGNALLGPGGNIAGAVMGHAVKKEAHF